MPRSMTGYGSGTAAREGRRIRVECRAVNHRYLDLSLRVPPRYAAFEPYIRSRVQERVDRGRLEIRLSDEPGEGPASRVEVDLPLARAYLEALGRLEELTGRPLEDPTRFLAAQSGVLNLADREEDDRILEEQIGEALDLALAALNRMREAEGAKLVEDLLDKTGNLRTWLAAITQRAPEVPRLYAGRLRQRAEELFKDERPEWYSDQRLFAETALFADRASIDEEITRLGAHLAAIEEALASTGPIGRRLDFLIQEAFREINTIGSKANDLNLSQAVVSSKTLLEQIREQIQNIE